MGKLDGKVAIVTGAGRGLGRSYAKRLAALGAKVAVTDVDLKSYREFEAEARSMKADSTVAEIEAIGGIALGFEMDVTDRQAVERTIGLIFDAWGRIDILIANAGGGRGQPDKTKASTLDPELLDFVVRTNFFGTTHCCTAVAEIMKEQPGKIITVSSIAGSSPSREGIYAHYGATKAAIAHYTRFLAQDLGPFRITANCIAPELIATGRIVQNVLPKQHGPGRSSKFDFVASPRNGGGLQQSNRISGDGPVRLRDWRDNPGRRRDDAMNYEGAFAYMLVPKRTRTRSKGIAAWQARATPPPAMTVYLDAR